MRERGAGTWIGEWIQAAESRVPGDADRQRRVGFRREINVTEVPGALSIRVSADSRYVFCVNGNEIGRGPVRSQPYRWAYDEYDLAPFLSPGRNVIAVLVTYYGVENAFWQAARVADGLGTDACLIVDAPAEWSDLATGPTWTARVFDAWTTVPGRGLLASLPIEVVDHRRVDERWLLVDGTRDWQAAHVAAATHTGGGRRTRPPAYPYGGLRPRGIAFLGGDTVQARPMSVRRLSARVEGEPVDVVLEALERPCTDEGDRDGALAGQAVGPNEPVLLLFDFGRVVSGYLEIDFEAPAGTVFDVAFLERTDLEGSDDRRYVPRAGARVVAAGGVGRYRALEPNGLRTAAILATPPSSGEVRVTGVRLREELYPFSGSASFSSSDPGLDRLWAAGERTVALNSSDAFMDCPTRERRAWVGDAVVHTAVHLVANEDWRLIERHLELADSPRPDGLLPMSVAGDVESAGRYSIPDWSLHWLHALMLYARASKRREFIRRRLPTAQRVLEWFETYADGDGILADVPEWPLGDWSSVFTNGRSALLTALWVRGLREFAELSEWVGNTGNAQWARTRIVPAAQAFEGFWDAQRCVYVDHIVDGRRQHAVSQATNGAAIVAGVVPMARMGDIVGRITDERRLVTRSWNAASPTVDLEQKVRDRIDGVQRIDWDARQEIVRAEPFFSFVVHDAVARAGRADLLPTLLRRWSRFLRDGYDTFGECWEWGTPAHGWSSAPTRDLIVHVLGVEPLGLDGDTYRVAPARTSERWMRATVPTAAGPMRVAVADGELAIETPVAVRIETWTGDELHRPPGNHRVDLLAAARRLAAASE